MKEYLRILRNVRENGTLKHNRTGIDTYSITGEIFKFDMSKGEFPLLTTKKMPPKCIFAELEGFIKGITSKQWYKDRKCEIWSEWANPRKVPYGNDAETKARMAAEDDLGLIYGYQWSNFNGYGINQLDNAIKTLKTNPTDRRMIVMAWNPCQLDQMALPPCHFGFHLLSDGEYLDLCWFQRSVDTFLGLPFNIASYAMLLKLIARETGLKERMLVGHLDDVHLYANQIEQADVQLSRDPFPLPKMIIPEGEDNSIYSWEYTNFELVDYQCHGKLIAEVAV